MDCPLLHGDKNKSPLIAVVFAYFSTCNVLQYGIIYVLSRPCSTGQYGASPYQERPAERGQTKIRILSKLSVSLTARKVTSFNPYYKIYDLPYNNCFYSRIQLPHFGPNSNCTPTNMSNHPLLSAPSPVGYFASKNPPVTT